MEQIALKANVREGIGKQEMQKLRKQGLVPAIVYHRGEKSVPITIVEKEILRILRSAENQNLLINLMIEGGSPAGGGSASGGKKKSRAVLIKEVQQHPVKRSILHIDFNEISMSETIIVEVGVVGQGEPVGVKQDGGVLDHPLREVKVQCLPADIPGHIDVDLSDLKIGDSIHVRDLKVSSKIKILTDPDTMLFQVRVHVEEKVDETAVAPELEVIREKKDDAAAPAAGAPAAGGKGAAAEKKEEPKKAEAPKGEKK